MDRQPPLCRDIGNGDQIARTLFADIAGFELLEARHDLLGGDLGDEPLDLLAIDQHRSVQHRAMLEAADIGG